MAFQDDILNNFKDYERVRQYYEPLWDDITKLVSPRRENITNITEQPGKKRGEQAFDGAANGALNTWTSGILGAMVSRSRRWFKSQLSFQPLNDDDEIRAWLQAYDEHMFGTFARSNFYTQVLPWASDAGSIGTGTMFNREDSLTGVIASTAVHPREVYIAEDQFGDVDTVYRKFNLTARQAVQMFTKDEKGNTGFLAPTIIESAEKTPLKDWIFLHCVFPNRDRLPGKSGGTNRPWRSVYLQFEASGLEGQKIVRDSGFDWNPYAVWRLRKNSNETYGYSPAADAIIEIISLNHLSKDMLMASQLSVASNMNAPEEMRGEVKLTPRGINYYTDPGRILSPVNNNIRWNIGVDQLERLQKSIDDKYGTEFFRTFIGRTGEATATEIIEIKSEQAQLIGPMIDSLENEALKRSFEIYSQIEDRAGRLPPTPEILLDEEFLKSIGAEGVELKVEFTGPLSQAQKRLFTIIPVKNALTEIAPLVELEPTILDRINMPQLAEDILKATNFPQNALRTDEEVAEIQAQRAQQAQQQAMLEMAEAAGKVLPSANKTVEEGSVAEQLLGV